jgi:hypothetical protein
VRVDKTEIPGQTLAGEPRIVREFYCKQCKLLEGVAQDEPAFRELLRRWGE